MLKKQILTALAAGLCLAANGQGYQVGESGEIPVGTPASANSGPVRMTRISLHEGDVSWRPSSDVDWAPAALNVPIRQGGSIWVKNGSRCEVQFDDGSMLRLGGGAIATFQTMFSDDHGEFTEIKLANGLATFHGHSDLSAYQFDTPMGTVKANGKTLMRLGVSSGLDVACQAGAVRVENGTGNNSIHTGDYYNLPNSRAQHFIRHMPKADPWDQFNNHRDQVFFRPVHHVPSNLQIVAGDLDSYGSWHSDPQYGDAWVPRSSESNWRPYHNGHWVWVSPFGWTWVAAEPWGWAPYHYGTWRHRSYGWGWIPGPSHQYWSPAVVNFTNDGNDVAWAALDPSEVRYPSELSFGFQSGNWALSFSIGGTGSYYPSGRSYCKARPWQNDNVNRVTNVYNVTNIGSSFQNAQYRNTGFIPMNSRVAYGTTISSSTGFGGSGSFRSPRGSGATIFQRGRGYAASQNGTFIAGPSNVRPSRMSYTPGRAVSANRPSATFLSRSVYRGNLPVAISRQTRWVGKTTTPANWNQGRALPFAPRPGVRTGGSFNNRTNSTRPGVGPTGQSRPGQVQRGPGMGGQVRGGSGQVRPVQGRAVQGRPGQLRAGKGLPTQGRTMHGQPIKGDPNAQPGRGRMGGNPVRTQRQQPQRQQLPQRQQQRQQPQRQQPQRQQQQRQPQQRQQPQRQQQQRQRSQRQQQQRQQPQRQQQQRQQPQRWQQQRQQPQRQHQQRQQPQRQQQQRQQPQHQQRQQPQRQQQQMQQPERQQQQRQQPQRQQQESQQRGKGDPRKKGG